MTNVIGESSTMDIDLLYTTENFIPGNNPDLLRIATYNILKFRGFPSRKAQQFFTQNNRFNFFERVMFSLNADVIVMQEVSSAAMVKALAKRLNMNAGFIPGSENSPENGGAILSRYPIKEFISFNNTKDRNGKVIFSRYFCRATISIRPDLDIMVYGTHLIPNTDITGERHRLLEVKTILSILKSEKLSNVPQFLMGDFNTGRNSSVIDYILRNGLYDSFVACGEGEGLTCNSVKLYVCVDYIFLEQTWATNLISAGPVINRWTSPNFADSISASDHLPYCISCKIPEIKKATPQRKSTNKDFSFSLNGTSYLMKWIPPGKFMMGSNYSYLNEQPIHRVIITQGFWMLEHEVTQGLWKSVMGNNPSYFKGNDNFSVEQVSWDDCKNFIKTMRKKFPGGLFDLPTEAEWEYAARADGTGNSNGKSDSILNSIAWYDENSGGKTHPIKKKDQNAWGLYDMLGNVYEWCKDEYVENAYTKPIFSDPIIHNENINEYVLRGGCWLCEHWNIRASDRYGRPHDYRNFTVGFRFILRSQTTPTQK